MTKYVLSIVSAFGLVLGLCVAGNAEAQVPKLKVNASALKCANATLPLRTLTAVNTVDHEISYDQNYDYHQVRKVYDAKGALVSGYGERILKVGSKVKTVQVAVISPGRFVYDVYVCSL